MKNRYLKTIAMAAGVAAALPLVARADYRYDDMRYDYARVVKVDAIVNHATQPVSRETCWHEPATVTYRPSYTYYRDSDDDDSGPSVITVDGGTQTSGTTQQHCRTETDYRTTDRVLSYDVTYRYNGRDYRVQMDHDPGDRVRVRVNYDYSVTPDN